MKGLTYIYTLLGTYFKEVSKENFMCASNKEVFSKPLYLKINYKLTET